MPKKRALIVAINEYGGSNALPSCIEDGQALARYLEAIQGFSEIRKLYDRDATVRNVEAGLDWLTEELSQDDRGVVYFSGHGMSQVIGASMEEFMVLLDDDGELAFWPDDSLVAKSRRAPPGTLVALFDCCHARGMTKLVATPSGSDVAKVKSVLPDAASKALLLPQVAEDWLSLGTQRCFGRAPRTFGAKAAQSKQSGLDADASEAGQAEFNGVLALACNEFETAAASTSQTGGLSAFTCKLLASLAHLPPGASNREVMAAAATGLAAGGFRQTCSAWAPDGSDWLDRSFITLEPRSTTARAPEQPVASSGGARSALEDSLRLLFAALPAALGAITQTQKEAIAMNPSAESTNGVALEKVVPVALIAAGISTLGPLLGELLTRRKDLSPPAPQASPADKALLDIVRSVIELVPDVLTTVASATRKGVADASPAANGAADKVIPLEIISGGISLLGDILRSTKRKELGAAPDTVAVDKIALAGLVDSLRRIVPQLNDAVGAAERAPNPLALALSALNGMPRTA